MQFYWGTNAKAEKVDTRPSPNCARRKTLRGQYFSSGQCPFSRTVWDTFQSPWRVVGENVHRVVLQISGKVSEIIILQHGKKCRMVIMACFAFAIWLQRKFWNFSLSHKWRKSSLCGYNRLNIYFKRKFLCRETQGTQWKKPYRKK